MIFMGELLVSGRVSYVDSVINQLPEASDVKLRMLEVRAELTPTLMIVTSAKERKKNNGWILP